MQFPCHPAFSFFCSFSVSLVKSCDILFLSECWYQWLSSISPFWRGYVSSAWQPLVCTDKYSIVIWFVVQHYHSSKSLQWEWLTCQNRNLSGVLHGHVSTKPSKRNLLFAWCRIIRRAFTGFCGSCRHLRTTAVAVSDPTHVVLYI